MCHIKKTSLNINNNTNLVNKNIIPEAIEDFISENLCSILELLNSKIIKIAASK